MIISWQRFGVGVVSHTVPYSICANIVANERTGRQKRRFLSKDCYVAGNTSWFGGKGVSALLNEKEVLLESPFPEQLEVELLSCHAETCIVRLG